MAQMRSTLPLFLKIEVVVICSHLIIQVLAQHCLYYLFRSATSPYEKVVPIMLPLILPGVCEIFKRCWEPSSLWHSSPQVHLPYVLFLRETFRQFVLDVTYLRDTLLAKFQGYGSSLSRCIGCKVETNEGGETAIDADIEDYDDTEDSPNKDLGSRKSDSDTVNETSDGIGKGTLVKVNDHSTFSIPNTETDYLVVIYRFVYAHSISSAILFVGGILFLINPINESFRNLVNIGFLICLQPVFKLFRSRFQTICIGVSRYFNYIARHLGFGIKKPITRLPVEDVVDKETVTMGGNGKRYGWPFLPADDDLARRFEIALKALPPLIKAYEEGPEKGMS
jgi:hypothetical protein